MSGIEMAVLVTFVTAAGLAAAYRAIAVASVFTLNDFRGKYKRRGYRKRMKKGMKDCNYKLFKEAIYDIKNYDIRFEKSYYNEMKKKYNFHDEQVDSRKEFYDRFNFQNKYRNTLEDILDYIDEQYDGLTIHD
jgi:hypothetical protein